MDRNRRRAQTAPPVKVEEDRPTRRAPTDSIVELEAGLRIDRHDLDSALVLQPDVFYRVSRNFAEAVSQRDGLNLDIKNAVAELDAQFRREASEAGDKITETGLAQEITNTVRVRDLKRKYIDSCRNADQWQALKEAFQQRSYVLKDLTALHISNYYSAQVGSGQSRNDARDRMADEARSRRSDALKDRG